MFCVWDTVFLLVLMIEASLLALPMYARYEVSSGYNVT